MFTGSRDAHLAFLNAELAYILVKNFLYLIFIYKLT